MITSKAANVCRLSIKLAAALIAVGGGAAAHGAIIDVAAATNAFVLRSGATTDQSEATALQTKRLNDSNTRVSYLRFDLPAGLDANDIAAASLRVTFVNNGSIGTGVTQDTIRVLGLNETAANGTVTEANWLDTITWNTQPARGAAPNDIPNSSTALPNANTTGVLGTSAAYPINATVPPATVIEAPLNLAAFQSFVAADGNDQVTLLFHNTSNVIVSWASRTNTAGHAVPTLRLDVVPEPGSAALAACAGGYLLARRRRRA